MAPIVTESLSETTPSPAKKNVPDEVANLPRLIETKQSGIHGLGTFTTAPLKKGQIFWYLDTETKVLPITREQHNLLLWAAKLNPKYGPLCEAVHCYCYFEAPENALMFILDGGRYLNHSETPNSTFRVLPPNIQVTVAARDLEAGEEIVENYFTYDRADWCPAPLSEYLIPDLKPCEAEGEAPAKGKHLLFDLSPARYATLKASPLPDGLGRVFFDACVPDASGGAQVYVEI